MKTEAKKIRWIVVAATAGVLVAALLWVVAGRLEGTPPVVVIDPAFAAVGQERIFALEVADPQSGLRQVRLSLTQEGKPDVILVDKVYPTAGWFGGGAQRRDRLELRLAPSEQGLGEGALSMTVEVRDNAWRNWWSGNRALIERRLVVDIRPPSIEVLSQAHNINQGGSGLVLYRVSEPCLRTGVSVGDTFYPGRPGLLEDSRVLGAFIALDSDQGRNTPLAVVAEDEAGNTARQGLAHHIRPKQWREDVLEISDGFLNAKMPELAALIPAPAPASPLDQYLKVNRDVRRSDYGRIQELTRKSDDQRHWHDTFIRLPAAANRALFADHRIYRYHGKEIDRQVHMGIDLASLANSPVPAANAGRVAFTGNLGIYGLTVLIDHGFGLFSMYSHLSRIDVAAEQMVERGATLGLTGMTGLAGGDHLHFSMLVGSTFVNPIEWWDEHWIRHNVTDKIEAVGK